jgi:Uncharacterized membrane-associated protein/domain
MSVDASIEVQELTSSKFNYVTTVDARGVNASTGNKTLDCTVKDLTLGSQIECPVEDERNFSIDLAFKADGLVEQQRGAKLFSYRQPIYRPTESYSLEAKLPTGAALDSSNSTSQVISPTDYSTETNGRRISVIWNTQPELGDSLSYAVLFNEFTGTTTPPNTSPELGTGDIAVVGLSALIIAAAGFLGWFVTREEPEEVSSIEDDLEDDQKELLDVLEEEGGQCLQKDVVESTGHSKAKISGTVSELTERGIIEKSKEGRSNSLELSDDYVF